VQRQQHHLVALGVLLLARIVLHVVDQRHALDEAAQRRRRPLGLLVREGLLVPAAALEGADGGGEVAQVVDADLGGAVGCVLRADRILEAQRSEELSAIQRSSGPGEAAPAGVGADGVVLGAGSLDQ
jgi:hypothetical protein